MTEPKSVSVWQTYQKRTPWIKNIQKLTCCCYTYLEYPTTPDYLPGFQMVRYSNALYVLVKMDHSNTELVRYSDVHCTGKKLTYLCPIIEWLLPFYFWFGFQMVGTIIFLDPNCVQKMTIQLTDGPVSVFRCLYSNIQRFSLLNWIEFI